MQNEGAARISSIDALLVVAWHSVRDEIFEGVRVAGYCDLTPAHVALVRTPSLDGQRPVQIAERMRITRQSVHELLTHLEHHGYLVREDGAPDRRARLVRLTEVGRLLELEITAQATAAEAQIAELIGEHRLRQLRCCLDALAEQLGDR